MEIKSEIKKSNIVILLLGGIGCAIISSFLIYSSMKQEYPQIVGLILGILFGTFGLFSIHSIWRMNKYYCDDKKLVIKTIFNTHKKTIYLNNITHYNEIDKKNKYSKWKDLTIYTPTGKHKISSSIISKYGQLKARITLGKKRDFHSEKQWVFNNNFKFGVGFILLGLIFTIGMLRIYYKKDEIIHKSQLSTINATIDNHLKIERKKSSQRIKITLKEYPSFIFEISGINFKAAFPSQIVSDLSKGDLIELDIMTETYQKKLLKTKDLDFWDKTINFNLITINGLRKGNKTYLHLSNINNEHYKDSSSLGFWMFLTFGIGIFSYGIYLITRKNPATQQR